MNSAPEKGFTREDLERDTFVGRSCLEGLVTGDESFTREDLLRDTYVVSADGYHLVPLSREPFDSE